ncbi:MAG TPA: dTMP kinase [Solirubrobacteraceae bacterium]|jgi:dTMP kinase|nr:dTMP kinase [Solirubrobacteraceae bacterium]
MPIGLLITIEGIDGAGKSTLAAGLHDALAERGLDVLLVRDPGGVELSEQLRAMLADPRLSIAPRAEAMLYGAARAQLVQELLAPAIGEGVIVVVDRFTDSSVAYQGAGRGLGIERVRSLNDFATGVLRPDRTLLLKLPTEVALRRVAEAGRGGERLEREPEAFFKEVAAEYDQIAAAEPDRVAVIDASAPPEAVLGAALEALEGALAAQAPD